MTRIMDADGHVVEPPIVWTEYTEPAYREQMIQVRRNRDGHDELFIMNENRSRPNLPVTASVVPGGLSDLEKARKLTWEDVPRGGFDPDARIKIMDEEGIDVAFLYPSLFLLYGDLTEPKLQAAACRAYSNWLADFCRAHPKRLFGVAPIPLLDVDEAVREMRRVVKDLGYKAVFVRPNPFGGRRLNDRAYDPFWLEAEELNVPVAVHSSFGTKMPTMGADRYRDPFFFHMVCHPFEQQAACMDVICGGVVARFPKLKVAFLESGIGWLGYWLDRMDSHYEKMHDYVPWMKKKPTEYFIEQCYLTLDPEERTLAAMVGLGMERNVLWGSDYPHFDCTYPGVLNEVRKAISVLPESARTKILTENAIAFYNLD